MTFHKDIFSYEFLEKNIETQDSVSDPEKRLSDIELTLRDLHGKVAESILVQYQNELNNLKPIIEKNLEEGKEGDRKTGLIEKGKLTFWKGREKYAHQLHQKLHNLEAKVYGTAKEFGIMSPQEKVAYIHNKINTEDHTIFVGPDGTTYSTPPAGVKCIKKSINVNQITQAVKNDPTKAITEFGLIPTGSAFLAKNTFIKPETAQVFLTIIALWGAWKTIGAIYDSKLGDKSILRTAFITAFGGAMFRPALKALAVGGYDKLPKQMFSDITDLKNYITDNNASQIDTLKTYENGIATGDTTFSFFKNTETLKKYVNSDGSINFKDVDMAIEEDVKNGGNQFMGDPNDPRSGKNQAFEAFGLLANEGANNAARGKEINNESKKLFEKLKLMGLFDLGAELSSNTPIDQIKQKFIAAKSAMQEGLQKESVQKLEKENDVKIALIDSDKNIHYDKNNQTLGATIASTLSAYSLSSLKDSKNLQDVKKSLLLLDGVSVKIEEDRDMPLSQAVDSIPTLNETEKTKVKEQFIKTREEIYKKEGVMIHLDWDADQQKLYLESRGCRNGIVVDGPNNIYLEGTNSSLSADPSRYDQIFHMADLVNGILRSCVGHGEPGDSTPFDAIGGNKLVFNRNDGNATGGDLLNSALLLFGFTTNIPSFAEKIGYVDFLKYKVAELANYLNTYSGFKKESYDLQDYKGNESKNSDKYSTIWRSGAAIGQEFIAKKNQQGEYFNPTNTGPDIIQRNSKTVGNSIQEGTEAAEKKAKETWENIKNKVGSIFGGLSMGNWSDGVDGLPSVSELEQEEEYSKLSSLEKKIYLQKVICGSVAEDKNFADVLVLVHYRYKDLIEKNDNPPKGKNDKEYVKKTPTELYSLAWMEVTKHTDMASKVQQTLNDKSGDSAFQKKLAEKGYNIYDKDNLNDSGLLICPGTVNLSDMLGNYMANYQKNTGKERNPPRLSEVSKKFEEAISWLKVNVTPEKIGEGVGGVLEGVAGGVGEGVGAAWGELPWGLKALGGVLGGGRVIKKVF